MPWYDPWDYWSDPESVEEPYVKKSNLTSAVIRAQEKLRRVPLKDRTSTYVTGSTRQVQGEQAEHTAQRWLQDEIVCAGSDWTVLPWHESRRYPRGFGPFDDDLAWVAIDNSQNGDLYVYQPGKTLWSGPKLLFSVEVKSSDRWPNVSITWSELTQSSARYLLGVTKKSTWICTMDDARKHAIEVEKHTGGSYWIVPQDKIRKLTIKEIIDGEEGPTVRREEGPTYGGSGGDIPF